MRERRIVANEQGTVKRKRGKMQNNLDVNKQFGDG